MVRRFFYAIIDFFFPRTCIGCEEEGVDLCAACQSMLCLAPKWQTIGDISVFSLYRYRDQLIAQCIEDWKYRGNQQMLMRIIPALRELSLPTADYLVPVPLHKKKLLERGFNQSLQLAQLPKAGYRVSKTSENDRSAGATEPR
jgi:predicted amidophosphoribosyltransferase